MDEFSDVVMRNLGVSLGTGYMGIRHMHKVKFQRKEANGKVKSQIGFAEALRDRTRHEVCIVVHWYEGSRMCCGKQEKSLSFYRNREYNRFDSIDQTSWIDLPAVL